MRMVINVAVNLLCFKRDLEAMPLWILPMTLKHEVAARYRDH